MLKLRLSYFGHIMRKTIRFRKTEVSRKRGGPNMRWIDSLKKFRGLSLQVLSSPVEGRTFWKSLIYRVIISWGVTWRHISVPWGVA